MGNVVRAGRVEIFFRDEVEAVGVRVVKLSKVLFKESIKKLTDFAALFITNLLIYMIILSIVY